MHDLGFGPNVNTSLYSDKKAAISIAHNSVQHDRKKHNEIDRHLIKKKFGVGYIFTPFMRSED